MNAEFIDFAESPSATHYLLSDGRHWDIGAAKFVSSVPDGAVCAFCEDVESLVRSLDFFKFPKGELKTDKECAAEARGKRNALIAETDFMLMPDYPLSEAKRQALTVYRQALRDVPAQSGFPRQIDWPVKP